MKQPLRFFVNLALGLIISVGGSLAVLFLFNTLFYTQPDAFIGPMFLLVAPFFFFVGSVVASYSYTIDTRASLWLSPAIYVAVLYAVVLASRYFPKGSSFFSRCLEFGFQLLPFLLWILCSWIGLRLGSHLKSRRLSHS